VFAFLRIRLQPLLRVQFTRGDVHVDQSDRAVTGDLFGILKGFCELLLWVVDDTKRRASGEVRVQRRDKSQDGYVG